jgi:hypothetical protein
MMNTIAYSDLSKNLRSSRPVFILGFWVIALFLSMNQAKATVAHNATLVNQQITQAELVGEGRLIYWGFKLYDAQLFASKESHGGYALDLQYLRQFEAKDLYKQTLEEMEKMGVTKEKRTLWDPQLSKAFKTVKNGDSITAIKKSRDLTQLFHNGLLISEIRGEELSKAFFGIWLHPRTSVPKLRLSLLGNSCPRLNLEAYCNE